MNLAVAEAIGGEAVRVINGRRFFDMVWFILAANAFHPPHPRQRHSRQAKGKLFVNQRVNLSIVSPLGIPLVFLHIRICILLLLKGRRLQNRSCLLFFKCSS